MRSNFAEYDYLLPLQNNLVEILKDLDEVCSSCNLKYSIAFGTLLGAVRHKSIIPWDDDVDVFMTRDDYDLLVEHFRNNTVDGYKLFCAELDENCTNLFAKFVRINNHCETLKEYYTHPEGLSIDIFPLDKSYDASILKQKTRWLYINSLRAAANSKLILKIGYKDNLLKGLIRRLYIIPFLPFSINRLTLKAIDVCKANNKGETSNLICYGASYSFEKQIWKFDEMLPFKKEYLLFEDLFWGPNNYDDILKTTYGSQYMKIPPNQMRQQHSEFSRGYWKDSKQ